MADSPAKSCITCPSFLTGPDVVSKFGRATGAPMCGRYGKVLGKPGLSAVQTNKLQEALAAECPSHGEPRPPEPGRDHQVMLPMPETRVNIDPDLANVGSCAQCKNFIGERVVSSETGWSSGLCAAKGKLILSNRLSYEARDCSYRQFGVSIGTTSGMHFLPIYDAAFTFGVVDPVREFMRNKDNFIEPGDWPTDREVSEGDRSAGIKSWRAVKDPHGSGKTAYLPVYDEAFFDDEDRALIPKTGDDEHPELYVDHFGGLYTLAVSWMELDETPIFHGQPGTGKTELLRFASWIMQCPFRRLSINADSQIEDVFGTKEFGVRPDDDSDNPVAQTYFVFGELPTAWTRPGVLVIDEPNTAKDPAIWHGIRPLTDNSKQMVLTMNGNQRLDRNADCYMAMAINPAWDVRNVGTMEVADADTNRLFHTYVPMPPEAIEKEIIKARIKLDGWEIEPDQLQLIMGIAKDLRELSDDDRLPVTWAIRQQIKVARALAWFTPELAYRRAIADALEPEVLNMILDVVKSHDGSDTSQSVPF